MVAQTRTHTRILRLNKAGVPLTWLTREEAVTLMVKDQVVWSLGERTVRIRGGYSSLGTQTVIDIPTIIATDGSSSHQNFHQVPTVSNRMLFRRDCNICMYCGETFSYEDLTRDHVIPRSRDGGESWTNLVTSCRRCNQRKGNRTPEEAHMPLLAVPFKPNKMEYLALANHNILADQMEFLKAGFSKNMRLE
ncbi:MAG: HNH endonuclease [Pseudomonadales bacterium]|nr:HNH endonuclease [Pseudomonadales bacterium]